VNGAKRAKRVKRSRDYWDPHAQPFRTFELFDDFETLVVKLAADEWSYELSEQQSGALPNGALPSEALPGAACRAYRAAYRGADGCILENLIVFQVCFQVIKRTLR